MTDFKTNFEPDNADLLTANHEEADTRIILHVLSAKMSGYFRCIDNDVLVLLVHLKIYFTPEVWMKAGRGENLRYIPVNEINLCENLSKN